MMINAKRGRVDVSRGVGEEGEAARSIHPLQVVQEVWHGSNELV
jgi:hypothetical protein